MTDATRILIVRARTLGEARAKTPPLPLGVTRLTPDGWRFLPFTSAHGASRKGHATWEKSLPRWTGGLDRTESRRMDAGETIAEVLKTWDCRGRGTPRPTT